MIAMVPSELPIDLLQDPPAKPNRRLHTAPAEDVGRASGQSWVFRSFLFIGWLASRLFGVVSVIFLLAVAANIPIIHFLSFGYLLETSGRLARRERFGKALIGLDKAARIGGVVLGAWLWLWPVRLASAFWMDAYVVDPHSTQQSWFRVLDFVLIVLVVGHIFSAVVCGGKLRYFFWPFIAPFSFAIWLGRKAMNMPRLKTFLGYAIGWLSPRLVDDLGNAQPISDWFLPAIVWKKLRTGTLFQEARDGLWDFVASLNLWFYLKLGFKGFVGSLAWLLLPTVLLVSSTGSEGGAAVMFGLLGSLIAIPVFSILPFMQAHFATDGNLRRFAELRTVMRNVGRAPLAHLVALLLTLVLALPLFLLKIEEIPTELLWTLSIVFIVFTWPARWIVGWAYRCGAVGEKRRSWFIRWPIWMGLFALSLTFVFVMFFTRYITWNGALSLVENHVFLLPSPFWLKLTY